MEIHRIFVYFSFFFLCVSLELCVCVYVCAVLRFSFWFFVVDFSFYRPCMGSSTCRNYPHVIYLIFFFFFRPLHTAYTHIHLTVAIQRSMCHLIIILIVKVVNWIMYTTISKFTLNLSDCTICWCDFGSAPLLCRLNINFNTHVLSS